MAFNQHPNTTGTGVPPAAAQRAVNNEEDHQEVDDEVEGEEVSDANEDHDIVTGRGKGFYGKPGHVRFHEVVEEYVDEYFSSNQHHTKQKTCQAIVDRMNSERRRFLTRKDDNRYVHMSRKSIDAKIGQRLRRQNTLRDSGKHHERSSLSSASSSSVGQACAEEQGNADRATTTTTGGDGGGEESMMLLEEILQQQDELLYYTPTSPMNHPFALLSDRMSVTGAGDDQKRLQQSVLLSQQQEIDAKMEEDWNKAKSNSEKERRYPSFPQPGKDEMEEDVSLASTPLSFVSFGETNEFAMSLLDPTTVSAPHYEQEQEQQLQLLNPAVGMLVDDAKPEGESGANRTGGR